MNERLMNLILQFQDKTGPQIEKVKTRFQELKAQAAKALGALNTLLLQQSRLWVNLHEAAALTVAAILGIRIALPYIEKLTKLVWGAIKAFLAWVVVAHVLYRTFEKDIGKILFTLGKFFNVAKNEFAPGSPMFKFFALLERQTAHLKANNPFTVLGNSLQALSHKIRGSKLAGDSSNPQRKGLAKFLFGTQDEDQSFGLGTDVKKGKNGLLSGGMGMLGDLVSNPKAIGGFLALTAAAGMLFKGIEALVALSVTWFELTAKGLTEVIKLAAQLGTALAAAFIDATKHAVELHSEYEKLQTQLEATIKTTSLVGSAFTIKGPDGKPLQTRNVAEAAKDQIAQIKKISSELSTVADQEIVAGLVESQVLGTMDKFTDALRGKVESGEEKKKVAEIAADMAANYGISFEDAMTTINQAALGRFLMLQRKTGITRGAARGASGSGNEIEGMFTLLERQSKGAASKMENTFDGAINAIKKMWKSEFVDFTTPAFENIRDLAISLKDTLKDIFKSEEWKAAKETLTQIFKSFTDFKSTGILENFKSIVTNILKVIGSPEVKEFAAGLAVRFQLLVKTVSELAAKFVELSSSYLPDIAGFFSQILQIGLTFFLMVKGELPKIVETLFEWGSNFLKLWATLGVVATGVLQGIGALVYKLLVIPVQKFFDFIIQSYQALKPAIDALAETNDTVAIISGSLEGWAHVWPEISKGVDTVAEGATQASNAMGDFLASLAEGKTLEESFSNAMSTMDLGGKWQDYAQQAKAALEQITKAGKGTEEAAKGANEAIGKLVPYEPETLKAVLDFYNELGQNQRSMNVLSKEGNDLLSDQLDQLKQTYDDLYNPQNLQRINDLTKQLVDNYKSLTTWAQEFMTAIDQANQISQSMVDSVIEVIDRGGGVMTDLTKQIFEQKQAVIQYEKFAGEAKIKMGQMSGDLNQMTQGQQEYNKAIIEEVDLREKIRQKMYESRKAGSDAILDYIEAEKGLAAAMTEGMGPMADYEAQRKLQQDQLEALKYKLQLQMDELKMLQEEQKLRGGMEDAVIGLNTEIVKTKTQTKEIENTLKNIAKPSLMEQILNAPQRVLALLPTSAQIYNRARTSVDEQKRGLLNERNRGVKILANIDQRMVGGSLMDATIMGANGAMDKVNGPVGTKFNPTHLPDMNEPGADIKDLIGKVNNDKSKLPGQAAMLGMPSNPQMMAQFNNFLGEYIKIAPVLWKVLNGAYDPNVSNLAKPDKPMTNDEYAKALDKRQQAAAAAAPNTAFMNNNNFRQNTPGARPTAPVAPDIAPPHNFNQAPAVQNFNANVDISGGESIEKQLERAWTSLKPKIVQVYRQEQRNQSKGLP
jgi:hypothetical protein